MASFTRLTVWIFVLVGIFTTLFAFIPSSFFISSYQSTVGQDHDVVERIELAGMIAYNTTGSANMTHVYSSYHDSGHAFNYSMPTDEFIEVIWDTNPILTGKAIYIFHIKKVWWGLEQLDAFKFKFLNGSWVESGPSSVWMLHELIWRKDLVSAYDPSSNSSGFYANCDHVTVSILFQYNQSKYSDIGDAFDGNELGFAMTYNVDYEATQVSAWTILGQLIVFQAPALGLTGTGGLIINAIIALPMYIMIVILIVKLAQSIIPFIRGIED